MRILHLAPRLSVRGGADWHLLSIVGALARENAQRLVVGTTDGSCSAPCPLVQIPALGARDELGADDALEAEVARHRPDVLHVHNIVNPAVLRWAAHRGALVTVQDHRFFCPGRGKWTRAGTPCRDRMDRVTCAACFEDESYFRRIHELTAARLDAIRGSPVTVLSRYMKRELLQVGLAAAEVHVHPPFAHGLDPQAEADGPPCVLFAGRLTLSKGVDDAIEAWRLSGLSLPLVFAGTGPERARLEQAGHQVMGWLPHDRLSQLYRRARVLLLPSRWQEPFGIVGLEALSMGTPVAAWDSGGVAEWHPGGDALVPWGDVEALARAAAQLAGQTARAPDGFTRSEQLHRLIALYRQNFR